MDNPIEAIPPPPGTYLFGKLIHRAPPPVLPPVPELELMEENQPEDKYAIVEQSQDPQLISLALRAVLDNLRVPDDQNPTHFFTRKLFKTDVNKIESRLAIPRGKILQPFLSDREEHLLQEKYDKGNLKRLEVTVIDPLLAVHTMNLCRWNYEKPKVNSRMNDCRWSYALNHGWMKLVECNRLAEGDKIQVWSFRFNNNNSLGFIVFKVKKTEFPVDSYDVKTVQLDHGSNSNDEENRCSTSLSLRIN